MPAPLSYPAVGDRASFSKTITDADIQMFSQISGDRNPVHLDEEFAKSTRFKGRIAHGVLALGLVSAVLGNQLPGLGTIYLNQIIRFLNPVRPGDTITATVEVLSIRPDKPILTLRTMCTDQTGTVVLDGEAVVLFEPPHIRTGLS